MHKCPSCDKEFDKLISLSIHYRHEHNGKAEHLCVLISYGGCQPLCACGCGKPTRFLSVEKGFTTYLRGHSQKIKNNWGHNPTVRDKSHASRNASYARGEWSAWNKGETKETDERLSAYGKLNSQNFSEEKKREYSERMSRHRLDGTVPTLRGKAHSQWKGGTSALAPLARARIYAKWTYPKLASSGFKCSGCGSSKSLEVHHSGKRFAEILHEGIETLGEPGDDFDRKDCFCDWVLRYHLQHDIPGIVLCATCHESLHATEFSPLDPYLAP